MLPAELYKDGRVLTEELQQQEHSLNKLTAAAMLRSLIPVVELRRSWYKDDKENISAELLGLCCTALSFKATLIKCHCIKRFFVDSSQMMPHRRSCRHSDAFAPRDDQMHIAYTVACTEKFNEFAMLFKLHKFVVKRQCSFALTFYPVLCQHDRANVILCHADLFLSSIEKLQKDELWGPLLLEAAKTTAWSEDSAMQLKMLEHSCFGNFIYHGDEHRIHKCLFVRVSHSSSTCVKCFGFVIVMPSAGWPLDMHRR